MFGLVGAGRTDVVLSLVGLEPRDAGKDRPEGQGGPDLRAARGTPPRHRPLARRSSEPGRHPRHEHIGDNITLPQVDALATGPFLNSIAERKVTQAYGTQMEIKASGWNANAKTLSGGNQQKVVLAKWLSTKPEILILDEPTKGIDVGAKATVHSFIASLAAKGLAIIMISSELPEILGMSDRILVMYEGRVAAVFDRDSASEASIMRAATGLADGVAGAAASDSAEGRDR